jgi:hypothetical protein
MVLFTMHDMELLGLVRFSPSHGVMQPVRLACDRFESLLPQFQAELLHREELQMMFVLGDLNKGLALLRVALDSASLDGFVISGGLAQGIRQQSGGLYRRFNGDAFRDRQHRRPSRNSHLPKTFKFDKAGRSGLC